MRKLFLFLYYKTETKSINLIILLIFLSCKGVLFSLKMVKILNFLFYAQKLLGG